MKNNITDALNNLNSQGYHRTNIFDLGSEPLENSFDRNCLFFDEMLNSESIRKELEIIKNNPSEASKRNKNKPFELNQHDYLKRALQINDGDFFHFYINDFFTSIASKFLETEEPKIFNILTWIHSWSGELNREGSQMWHRDREDYKLLKIFVYYKDVSDQDGPFQYVPNSFCGADFNGLHSGRNSYWDYASNSRNYGHPKSSEELAQCESNHVSFTGKKGDIIMVNNSGFHRGGYVKGGMRIATHACYLRPDAYQIKEQKYFTSFNYDKEAVNYIDFNSEEFKALGEKTKHFLIHNPYL
jgi:hypothetical protein